MGKNLLFTGPPGCGKTTLIERAVRALQLPARGFLTREIRQHGRRVGFSMNTLEGETAILAHMDFGGPYRVGKYGVDLHALNRLAVPALQPGGPEEIVVIDEIGKMECMSRAFRQTVRAVLSAPNPVLGSIALKGGGFIAETRDRADLSLITVTRQNRDSLVHEALRLLLPRESGG